MIGLHLSKFSDFWNTLTRTLKTEKNKDLKPKSSSKATFQHAPFRDLILDYQNMIRLGSEMLAVLSNQHKVDTKVCFWNKFFGYLLLFLFSWITNILWNSNFHIFTQKAVAMTLKSALLLAIGSQPKLNCSRKKNGPLCPGKYSNFGIVQVKCMRERSWVSRAWSERPLPSSSLSPVEAEMEEVVEVEREALYILPRDSWGGGGGVEEGLLLPTFVLIPQ